MSGNDYDERFDSVDSKLNLNSVLGAGNLLLNLQQSHNVAQAREQLERIEQGLLQESLRKQVLETLREYSLQDVRSKSSKVRSMRSLCTLISMRG